MVSVSTIHNKWTLCFPPKKYPPFPGGFKMLSIGAERPYGPSLASGGAGGQAPLAGPPRPRYAFG